MLRIIPPIITMSIGLWMIRRDIQGIYVVNFCQSLIGTGLITLGVSHILNQADIMSDETYSKAKIVGTTLTTAVPIIIGIIRKYRDVNVIHLNPTEN